MFRDNIGAQHAGGLTVARRTLNPLIGSVAIAGLLLAAGVLLELASIPARMLNIESDYWSIMGGIFTLPLFLYCFFLGYIAKKTGKSARVVAVVGCLAVPALYVLALLLRWTLLTDVLLPHAENTAYVPIYMRAAGVTAIGVVIATITWFAAKDDPVPTDSAVSTELIEDAADGVGESIGEVLGHHLH